MTRGGARVNSGPPPDPNALRRDRKDDKDGWTTLPSEGRKGRTPRWPLTEDIELQARRDITAERVDELEFKASDAPPAERKKLEARLEKLYLDLRILDRKLELQLKVEKKFWAEMWRTPQAVAWDRLGWNRDVAQYVRHKVRGELGELKDAQEARQWSDRLGLNPASLLRLRWRIAPDALAARRGAPTPTPAKPGRDMRSRIKLVTSDGGE